MLQKYLFSDDRKHEICYDDNRGDNVSYKSVDELETISFHDSCIKRFEFDGNEIDPCLTLELTGVVVREGNSQNVFYTDKYTDTMVVRFKNTRIEKLLLEGHKYYDANDNLLEQIPDQEIAPEEYRQNMKLFQNAYIFYGGNPDKTAGLYQMIIDVDEESYVLSIYYDKVIAEWEHFLNKAQGN